MAKKICILALITILFSLSSPWIDTAAASLPNGNRLKDPYAILRNSLPIDQKELRELQNKLEDTNDDLRGSRWSAINKATSRSQFLVSNRKNQILDSIPEENKEKAVNLLSNLNEELDELRQIANEKNKVSFVEVRRQSLKTIDDIESLLITNNFPHKIPSEYDNLPRLLGRANVEIKTSKGNMVAIIDGYNAPLTAGAFIDLSLKGFYDGLPINRAEEFFILQTGDPIGEAIGYIDPDNNELRKVPLEIRTPNLEDTLYGETFEEVGLYTETPALPFATLGTLGWAHSDSDLNDGSSQFFFFLYEAELNPAGRNLIDGRNAAFGYVIEGSDILNKLGVDDKIISIKVLNGSENLKLKA
ncbi:peptidylprolyl isomerase [Prochlorococcus marinus]|uniref:peptidylprolyl isomerase n=1 Tax=Prochlorococcus marinus TaxID=1219 RepID=UPI0022B3FAEB|nr:peptidylprolyl isomerase [Prochlorococcus marinus]